LFVGFVQVSPGLTAFWCLSLEQGQFSVPTESKSGSRRTLNQSLDPDAAFDAFLSSLEACTTSAELHSLMSRLLTLVLLNPDG
jgi:hypothetical protein